MSASVSLAPCDARGAKRSPRAMAVQQVANFFNIASMLMQHSAQAQDHWFKATKPGVGLTAPAIGRCRRIDHVGVCRLAVYRRVRHRRQRAGQDPILHLPTSHNSASADGLDCEWHLWAVTCACTGPSFRVRPRRRDNTGIDVAAVSVLRATHPPLATGLTWFGPP